jgi:long-chain acyl-CoA synthetase
VRRNVIAERYGELIAALDRGDESVSITNTVTYQDGTTVKRTINLKIYDLERYVPPTHKKQRPVWSGRR